MSVTIASFQCPTCDAFPYETRDELNDHLRSCAGSRPTASDRFETVPNGFGGTTTRRRTVATPATDRQLAYVRTLLAERSGVDAAESVRETLNAARTAGTLDRRTVSTAIDALLAVDRPRRPAPAPGAEVPAGRYAIDTADGLRFYLVEHGTGRWDGRTFVSVLASDTAHPVRNSGKRAEVLAAIAADPAEAMARYGQHIGRCGACNRTLTNADSRARGIGPECASRL